MDSASGHALPIGIAIGFVLFEIAAADPSDVYHKFVAVCRFHFVIMIQQIAHNKVTIGRQR